MQLLTYFKTEETNTAESKIGSFVELWIIPSFYRKGFIYGNDDTTETHAEVLRMEEEGGIVKKKSSYLKPMSQKRAQENQGYGRLKRQFHLQHPTCEVRMRGAKLCGRPAMKQPHHMAGREGEWLLKILFWLPVCLKHHKMIHDNPAWAYQEGYMVLRK